jgi:small subunit ribosomal protein S1
LGDDPWHIAVDKYSIGTILEGEIVKIAEFGLFVRVEDDIEALVHVSEIADEKVENLSTRYKVGEKVQALVISLDPIEKKMALSIKSASHGDAVKEIAKAQERARRSRPTLGDVMDEGLKQKGRRKKTPEPPEGSTES